MQSENRPKDKNLLNIYFQENIKKQWLKLQEKNEDRNITETGGKRIKSGH